MFSYSMYQSILLDLFLPLTFCLFVHCLLLVWQNPSVVSSIYIVPMRVFFNSFYHVKPHHTHNIHSFFFVLTVGVISVWLCWPERHWTKWLCTCDSSDDMTRKKTHSSTITSIFIYFVLKCYKKYWINYTFFFFYFLFFIFLFFIFLFFIFYFIFFIFFCCCIFTTIFWIWPKRYINKITSTKRFIPSHKSFQEFKWKCICIYIPHFMRYSLSSHEYNW